MNVRAFIGYVSLFALFVSSAGAQTQTPLPVVKGPLPVTAASHPWGGAAYTYTPIDLAKHGFVEEEYLVSGTANVYDWTPYANYATTVLTAGPYTTRILVRRPADPRRFSGRVVVEIVNMSDAYDFFAIWSSLWQRILANGDAYVGITSKANVFPGLQQFDAERYGALAMNNPLPPAQQKCGSLPTDAKYNPNISKLYENGLAYDIFSQVGALLKSNSRSNPLKAPARSVYLTSESQSSIYLYTYYKWLHNKALVKSEGDDWEWPYGLSARWQPVYDGYLAETANSNSNTAVRFGDGLNQCSAPLPADDPQTTGLPGRGVPLVMINSQWDFFGNAASAFGYAPPKPDSNTRTDKTRQWELASSNHGWTWQYQYGDINATDLAQAGFPPSAIWFCPADRPEVPLYMAEKALYEGLIDWTEHGRPPPSAPRITLDANNQVVYDQYQNAQGGLRLPMAVAPIDSYGVGRFFLTAGCPQIVPFSQDTLTQLYPTREAYLHRYAEATLSLIGRGYILGEDAQKLINLAIEAPVR
jgi:hypothetical protein